MAKVTDNRAAEFEERYQALLKDRYKQHSPCKLRKLLEDYALGQLRHARNVRGKDLERFKMAVANVEKAWHILDLLAEALSKEAA